MKKILLLFVLAIVTLASCRKDKDEFVANPPIDALVVSTSFKGVIVDEAEMPLANVQVQIGTSTVMTDEQGFFVLNNQMVEKEKAFITATKAGFFSGSRTLRVQANTTHNVRILLMSDDAIGTIANADGGTINLPNGSSVVFPANAVAHEDGTAYTGTVHVSAKYIDPSTLNGQMSMPGDLRAIDSNTEVQALTSYGMIAVELKDDSGDLLQVAPNKSVQLQLEIPTAGLASATDEIPLWYFDNAKASWIQEGKAVKNGSKYIGEVRHFSFWNCDIPHDYTSINLNFTDSDGNPVSNLSVELSSPTVPYSPGYGWTNSAGYTGGIIPSGVVLTMTVRNDCGAVLLTQDIGPFDMETTLDFVVDDLSVFPLITGTLMQCDGVTPVTDGYITITNSSWWANNTYPVNDDGTFSFSYNTCLSDTIENATLLGYDVANLTVSDAQTVQLSPNVDLGIVHTCTQLDEYFHVEDSNGDVFTALNPYMGIYDDSLGTGEVIYLGFEDNQENFLGINSLDIDAVGTYSVNSFANGWFSDIVWTASPNGNEYTFDLVITSFPDVIGEHLIGTGTITSLTNGDVHDISFKILRDN